MMIMNKHFLLYIIFILISVGYHNDAWNRTAMLVKKHTEYSTEKPSREHLSPIPTVNYASLRRRAEVYDG